MGVNTDPGSSHKRPVELVVSTRLSEFSSSPLRTSNLEIDSSRADRDYQASSEQFKSAPLGGRVKRAMDLAIALPGLVLMLPVICLVGLLIRLTTGGPIFFSQQRIGYKGSRFQILKFRTMRANADEVLRRHLACDQRAADEWAKTQKLENDPRVTRLGHFLRKSSLDEVPQLINVLRGDMSCVGPRPVIPDELQRYGHLAADYLRARPGLTGIWQVSGRNRIDYPGRVFLDRDYVRNWSLIGDLSILIQTIPAVLRFDNTS